MYRFIVLCLLLLVPVSVFAQQPEPSAVKSSGPSSLLGQILEKAKADQGEDGQLNGPVTLQNFRSMLLVVNLEGVPNADAEDWLAEELKPLKVSAVPEEMAWQLYKLLNSEGDEAAYQQYLPTVYDTVLQADVFQKENGYSVKFTLVNYKDPQMPVLLENSLEADGSFEITMKGIFKAYAGNLAVARSGGMSS